MENDVKNCKVRPKGLYPLIIPDVVPVTEQQPSQERMNYRMKFFSKLSSRDLKESQLCENSTTNRDQHHESFVRSKSIADDRSNHRLSSWVCPNDRQLMLRAKLHIGWSVKAELYEKYGCKPKPLSDTEQEVISSVIKRAEALEKQEQERIGRLVERLDNMKRHALGTGMKQCVLCGDKFGFLGSSCMICHDCNKSVCTKCGIEAAGTKQKETIWLCKICAETREMWKKSGAWFYKSMPKYVLPPKSDKYPSNYRMCEGDPLRNKTPDYVKEEEESSSEDDIRTTISAPARYMLSSRSTKSSPTSPGSGKNMPVGLCSSSSSPKVPKVTISEVNNATAVGKSRPYDRPFRREESFESGSSRTQSSESGGSVPQIFVNYCDAESGFESNNRDLSESDKSSVSSCTIGNHGNDDYADEESSSVDSVPKPGTSMGTIELCLQYDPAASSLHISLHRAKGLKSMDINGLSDPFCKLNLLPVGAKSYRLRTRTVNKTVNPDFNETLTFYGITDDDILTQSLHILILDDDKYGHDFLGEAKFPLHRLKPGAMRDLCLNLEKHIPGDLEDEVWGEGCGSNGQIVLTLLYSTRKRALIVGIARCVNLIPMDSNGYSDPFVKLWLKSPEGSSPKYKTSIKWKNLNPVYNEEFVIDTKITDLSRKSLIVTVWDKDPGRSNDYLGCLELGCHSKGDRLRQWIDMIKYPDHKHEGIHNLSEDPIRN